jgi:hypothetical protein
VVGTVSNRTLASDATAVSADAAGNLYVGGVWTSRFVTGFKGKNPLYGYSQAWTIRESTDGGASWSIVDSYNYPGSSSSSAGAPMAMGTDLAGNVYAVGGVPDGNNLAHAIIRTNADTGWHNVDDYTGSGAASSQYLTFAVDPSGNLYAGGRDSNGYFVRSAPGPVPAASSSSASSLAAIFSTQPASDLSIRHDSLVDLTGGGSDSILA